MILRCRRICTLLIDVKSIVYTCRTCNCTRLFIMVQWCDKRARTQTLSRILRLQRLSCRILRRNRSINLIRTILDIVASREERFNWQTTGFVQ